MILNDEILHLMLKYKSYNKINMNENKSLNDSKIRKLRNSKEPLVNNNK